MFVCGLECVLCACMCMHACVCICACMDLDVCGLHQVTYWIRFKEEDAMTSRKSITAGAFAPVSYVCVRVLCLRWCLSPSSVTAGRLVLACSPLLPLHASPPPISHASPNIPFVSFPPMCVRVSCVLIAMIPVFPSPFLHAFWTTFCSELSISSLRETDITITTCTVFLFWFSAHTSTPRLTFPPILHVSIHIIHHVTYIPNFNIKPIFLSGDLIKVRFPLVTP